MWRGASYVTLLLKLCSSLENEFLVSKETVLLRRWERSKQKIGFVKRFRKLTFRALALRQSEGLTLETSAF